MDVHSDALVDTLSGDTELDLPEFDDPPRDPLALLAGWIADAAARGVREPLALALSTVNAEGLPSSRIVLLKPLEDGALAFSTHTASRMGRDLESVARASGTLYWRETLQQVTLAGAVARMSGERSDRLFAARPRSAQATTAVSQQGEPLGDPRALSAAARSLADGSEPIARPAGWSGYVLEPDHIEFWHGRPDRLHRRLAYTRSGEGWTAARLQP